MENVASKPKFTVSVVSSAAIARGTMPQAVHNGALTPATAAAATCVLRVSPPGSRLKKSSGASAVIVTFTNCAELQSASDPVAEVASATVA